MASDKISTFLKSGIQIISILFAAFGGFLVHIAPPGGIIKLSVGIAQFIILCILLYISALSVYSLAQNKRQYKKNYKVWLTTCGIALISTIITSVIYFKQHNQLVIKVDRWDAIYVRGTLSEKSLEICNEEKISGKHSCEMELLNNYYTAEQVEDGYLWSPESIKSSQLTLLICYLAFMLSLSITIFSAIELISSGIKVKSE
ncbi:MAG: hypothetical protein GXC73_20775 [Chitinophagaceae bacterium]|nr:hypothetical protein [Chitinophagaceae bacterium]